MESVSSMDRSDRAIMSEAVGEIPARINASGVSLANRPRLYWCDWELLGMEGVELTWCENPQWGDYHSVSLTAVLDPNDFLEAGWRVQHPEQRLPTFTTSRPWSSPDRKPAGLQLCSSEDRYRWEQDAFRFPPYQYKAENCLINRQGELRVASLLEREVIMGLPAHYTQSCVPKSQRKGQEFMDTRLTLIGTAWCVQVVTWLIGCLAAPLGLCPFFNPQQIVQACKPGGSGDLQRLLLRPPIRRNLVVPEVQGIGLVRKLAGLVSMKGEDLLLQATSDQQVKFGHPYPLSFGNGRLLPAGPGPASLSTSTCLNFGQFSPRCDGGFHNAKLPLAASCI